jgi:hypothetical protein
VRALLLELARPADWDALGAVWRGVQTDLQLPAPAIAVSGTDGLQLRFSLQQPVSAACGADFLARLRARYLPGIAPARLRLLADGALPTVPAQDAATGNWSAFIAPDLAPVFVDTPWLDIPPGVEGQADLLARLKPIKPAELDEAMQRLQPLEATPEAAPHEAPLSSAGAQARGGPDIDPRRFLQQVLNDESVSLALRMEAAKALLLRS